MHTTTLAPEEARAGHTQAGRKIEYLSIAWTKPEGVAGIMAGVLAGSVALIGFGVDSAIEIASSIVLLWRLTDHPQAEVREKVAHRIVGVGFLALAAYISFDALHDLVTHELPRVSYFGIVYAAACIVVMPLLARAKRRVAAQLGMLNSCATGVSVVNIDNGFGAAAMASLINHL